MSIVSKIKRMLRGEVDARTAALEVKSRWRKSQVLKGERAQLDELDRQPAHLSPQFANLSPAELLAHFRSR